MAATKPFTALSVMVPPLPPPSPAHAGVDVNLLDFNKCSALHIALETSDSELVELLLAAGADVNQPNPDFTTCLHLTSHRGSSKLMQALLAKGADTSATNKDGWAPLHLAARAGNTDKVSLLLAAGASAAAKNAQVRHRLSACSLIPAPKINPIYPTLAKCRRAVQQLPVLHRASATPACVCLPDCIHDAGAQYGRTVHVRCLVHARGAAFRVSRLPLRLRLHRASAC